MARPLSLDLRSRIADNLGSHKRRSVRAALRAVSAKLFCLPAYSPDLNPIEMVFAKLKALLHKADERSVERYSIVKKA